MSTTARLHYPARRVTLGWSCHKVDEVAGLQSSYWAKVSHPDAPSGRVAQWEVLGWIFEALFPKEKFELLAASIWRWARLRETALREAAVAVYLRDILFILAACARHPRALDFDGRLIW